MDDTERERLLALLEATHRFPGPFYLAVVARSGHEVGPAIRAAVREVVDGVEDEAWEERPSSAGKYLSHRVTLIVESPTQVLALYACLRDVPGVISIL